MPPKSADKSKFADDLTSKGFNDKTIKELSDNDFVDEKGLELLAKTPAAIDELELSLQQKLLLIDFVGATANPAASGTTVSKLQDVMGNVLAGENAAKIATGQPPLPGTMDPNVYLQGGLSLEKTKFLDIIDYINMVPPMSDEKVVCEDGGVCMVVRSGTKRPQLEHVAIEEWALANTRIMNELMKGSEAFCVPDYMAHTIKICQLFKRFDRHSVLQFDREYRYLQSVYNFRWGTDNPFLHTTCLRPKTQGYASVGKLPGDRNRAVKSSELCRLYNTEKGCHFATNCKYVHKCNYAGCSGTHSRAQAHGTEHVQSND